MKTKMSEIRRIMKQVSYNQKLLDELKSKDVKNEFTLDTIDLLEEGISNQIERVKKLNQALLN